MNIFGFIVIVALAVGFCSLIVELIKSGIDAY
jgi:hypothetical protein